LIRVIILNSVEIWEDHHFFALLGVMIALFKGLLSLLIHIYHFVFSWKMRRHHFFVLLGVTLTFSKGLLSLLIRVIILHLVGKQEDHHFFAPLRVTLTLDFFLTTWFVWTPDGEWWCLCWLWDNVNGWFKKFPSHVKHLSFMKQQAKRENQIKRPTYTPCIDNILQGIEFLNNLLQFPKEWMQEKI